MTIQLNYESPSMRRWRTSGFTDFEGLTVLDRRQLWNALMRGQLRENGEPLTVDSPMYQQIVQETEWV